MTSIASLLGRIRSLSSVVAYAFVVFAVVFSNLLASYNPVQAATGDRFYFTGVNTTYRVGQTFTAAVHVVASPARVDWLEVTILCNSSYLRIDRVVRTSALPGLYGGGSDCRVGFTDEQEDYISGDVTIANITFTVLKAGSTSLYFDDTTGYGTGYPLTGTKSPANITIYDTTCPAGQTGTPPNCSSPPLPDVCPNIAGTQTTVPAGMIKDGAGNCVTPVSLPPPTTPIPPPSSVSPRPTNPLSGGGSSGSIESPYTSNPITQVIDDPTGDSQALELVGDDILESIDISVTMNTAEVRFAAKTSLASSQLVYGEEGSEQKEEASLRLDGDRYVAEIKNLKPKTTYEFEIKAASSDLQDVTAKGSFTTIGYPIVVRVTNGEQVLSSQLVEVETTTYTSDEKGEVFADVAGDTGVSVKTTYAGKDYETTFNVLALPINEDGLTADSQQFVFDISKLEGSSTVMGGGTKVGIFLIVLALFGALAWLIKRKLSSPKSYAYTDEPPAQNSWDNFMASASAAAPHQVAPTQYAAAPQPPPQAQPTTHGTVVPPSPQYTGPLSNGLTIPHADRVGAMPDKVEDMYEEAKRTHRFE